ncbi:MAG: hypothetical protein IKF14_10325 [Atopobiaceae bacterium]|nr:hypothetical protein [Atopobiaceae bacterium]
MALDWNQEVSLATIMDLVRPGQKGKKGGSGLPSKTTINLYQPEASTMNLRKAVLILVLSLVVLAAFLKFGVLDPLTTLSQKQAQLQQQQELLTKAASATKDYREVQELYNAYVAEYGSGAADAISVLDMVEKRVMGSAKVTGIVLADHTVTLTIEGVSLQTVGDLASDLEKDPMVLSTNVSKAATQNAGTEETSSTIVIMLAGAESKEK